PFAILFPYTTLFRSFRWSFEQRSRLVESLLLELPIPSIFVIEKESGVLELIDGLQRISSILHFIDAQSLELRKEAQAGNEEDEADRKSTRLNSSHGS